VATVVMNSIKICKLQQTNENCDVCSAVHYKKEMSAPKSRGVTTQGIPYTSKNRGTSPCSATALRP